MTVIKHPDSYYVNVRRDVIEYLQLPPLGNVLEIGGGEFPTLKLLTKQTGGESWGVDIFHPVEPPDHFLLGSIEDPLIVSKIPEGKFDIILMNDVLEHLWDTRKVLDTMFRLLKPGGQLAISVPNVRQVRFAAQVLFRGTFPRNPSGMFDGTHMRWFTKKDIVQAAKDSGFTVRIAVNRGRIVPAFLRNSLFGELLGLHTIMIVEKP